MTEEKIDMIPECDPTPRIPKRDAVPLIQETDSEFLVPESDPTLVISKGTESKAGHRRRFSTGNVVIPYKSVKILSRYLSASTSSCHDYCKYGTREDLEKKATSSPRLAKIMEKQGNGDGVGKSAPIAERKKKFASSFTSFPGSKGQKPDIPFASKKDVSLSTKKGTVLVKQFSLPVKEIYANPKPMLSSSSTHSSGKDDGKIHENKETCTFLVNSQGASSSREQIKIRQSKEKKISMLDEKQGSSRATVSLSALHSVKKVLMRPIVSLSAKRSAKRVSHVNTEKLKSLRTVSLLKDQSGVGNDETEQLSREDVQLKSLHVIESNAETENGVSTQTGDPSPSLYSFNKDKSLKNAQKGNTPAEKTFKCAQYRFHASRSLPSTENKSLRCIKQGTHVIRSSISSLVSSKPTNRRSTLSEHCENDVENGLVDAKVEVKTRARKGGVVSMNGKGLPVRKLSFRAGKVLELRPVINSPRKLKFRRGLPSDSQNTKVETTESNLKKIEVDADYGETNVVKSEHENVALKHRDVEKKVQNSLNNMIEETVNKLAESRKSKVKALVGAFETVISLQDTGPFSTVDGS